MFYTCAWSCDLATGVPLVAVGGVRGIIRVINLKQNVSVANIIGHGQAINEIKIHPRQLDLLISASKDHAIRIWNIKTQVCIALLGSIDGHRDEVISLDINLRGEMIISGGMDHSLKIWNIATEEFKQKIQLSYSYSVNRSRRPFPTIFQRFPDFSTRNVHRNYVDCVHWFGNFVLSKSCEDSITCWKPGNLNESLSSLKADSDHVTIIHKFKYSDCDFWYMKFAFNPWLKLLAFGNEYGKLNIWKLDASDPEQSSYCSVSNGNCRAVIRQSAFSRDGSVLVCVCDDSTVWRWNCELSNPLLKS